MTGGLSYFLDGVGLLGEYPFRVMNKNEKTKITRDLLGIGIVLMILSIGISKKIQEYWARMREMLRYFDMIVSCLLITLIAIMTFIVLIQKNEIEVENFSFISTSTSLFMTVLVAMIGWKISQTNKEKEVKTRKDRLRNNKERHMHYFCRSIRKRI